MRQPVHAVSAGRREMTPERIAGIGFVAVLHVVVIWAIVSGLAQKIVRAALPPDIVVVQVPHEKVLPPPPPQPKMPTLPQSHEITAQPPPFQISDDEAKVVARIAPPPPTHVDPPLTPDQAATGIAATHTIPPYPLLERRLGEQGTVTLSLTISPQGIVTGADVLKSSGYPGLDQSAIGWVMAHWKYKPAVRNGSPVASQTTAAVVFNLKTAG
jgi:protein TonB